MKDRDELMALMVENPGLINSIYLSASKLNVFNFVRQHSESGVTSRNIADHLGITVQSASTRLKDLLEKGYLIREQSIGESGGLEYIYKAAF